MIPLNENIHRDDIYIISRNSNMGEPAIDRALKENIYNTKEAWQKFLRLFFLCLGVGFTVSGIVFFFAYNWADLHKFAKLGLIEGLLIATTSLVLLSKADIKIRNIILTGSAVLVGVLFAVFGQIYQTGANAYDFFLGWSVFVTLWVVISNFPPLWLLFVALVNTTVILYAEQVANDWSKISVFTILFIINTTVLIASIVLSHYRKLAYIPTWFSNVIALSSIVYATIGLVIGIFSNDPIDLTILSLISAIVFATGFLHGLNSRSVFFISSIPLSVIVIVVAWLIKIADGELMLLLISFFVISSVTFVIKNLIDIQKKWANER